MPSPLSRRSLLAGGAALGSVAVVQPRVSAGEAQPGPRPPNMLVVYLDDLGYGDLSCYGSPTIRTPHLDQLARQGTLFTQGYSGAPVCTPSRAALMTGRVPPRSGLTEVLYPEDSEGLPREEHTLAEYLQEGGYYTAAIGKWHLGRPGDHGPTRHGFEHSFGIDAVYSDNRYPIELRRDDKVVGTLDNDADLALLTGQMTDEAIAAMDAAGDRPFFIYLAETSPHIPVVVEPGFEGRSAGGPYGDMIEALDHHLGRLFTALRRRGLDGNTLVLVVSDNGPDKGSAGPLRGGKWEPYEGGMRVPFIARWPGSIPPNRRSDAVVSVMDLLPTACTLAGVSASPGITLDGTDISPLLRGRRSENARPPIWYYLESQVAAVRDGDWKLVVRRRGSSQAGLPELYDLGRDLGEATNLAAAHPEVVERLQALIAAHEADVRGEGLTGPLRVKGVTLGSPLVAGAAAIASVRVEHVADPVYPGPAEVTATLRVPPGWTAGSVTLVVDQGVTATFEIPVTPPFERARPGILTEHSLTAEVTAGTTPVSGHPRTRTVVVPSATTSALALDAGTATSPLFPSYTRLAPATAWDPARGFGWVGTPPESRDRTEPDSLRRDMITRRTPAVLRVALPSGLHVVSVLRGDQDFSTTGIVVDVDGSRVVSTGPAIGTGEYWWEVFEVDGGPNGRTADLTFSNDQGVYWKVQALVVH